MSDINFAAVRYYNEISAKKKIDIVSISDIEDFIILDNYANYPVHVLKKDKDGETIMKLAAQILEVAEKEANLVHLTNSKIQAYDSNRKRPKFVKRTLSQASQMILERQAVAARAALQVTEKKAVDGIPSDANPISKLKKKSEATTSKKVNRCCFDCKTFFNFNIRSSFPFFNQVNVFNMKYNVVLTST